MADDARWLDPAESRAWRGYVQMSEQVRARIARDLQRDSGLSDADYGVLVRLSEAPGGRLRMTDLAGGLGWSRSRLSHQVTRMGRRGLVRRAECPTDARGSFAALTSEGRRVVEQAAPRHVESVRRHFVDRLSADQLGALADVAEDVLDALATDHAVDGVSQG